jgi:hypothetical protein
MAPTYGWLLTLIAGGGSLTLPTFQKAGSVGIVGIVVAIILSFFLEETGHKKGIALTSPINQSTSEH